MCDSECPPVPHDLSVSRPPPHCPDFDSLIVDLESSCYTLCFFFFSKFVSGQSRCFAFSCNFWKLLISFWQWFARILVVIFMGYTSVWERTNIGITASVLQCGSSYIYLLFFSNAPWEYFLVSRVLTFSVFWQAGLSV